MAKRDAVVSLYKSVESGFSQCHYSKCKFGKCVSYTENRVLYTVFRVAYTAHFRGFGGDYKI